MVAETKMTSAQNGLAALAARVAAMHGFGDNSLDVLIEVALFQPDHQATSIRANAAGTKVILTAPDGDETTYWPFDWTMERERAATIEALRMRVTGSVTTPVRVQLSRAKGWRMPANTVKVDRSTRYGNRYRVWQQGRRISDRAPTWVGCHDWEVDYPTFTSRTEAAQRAVTGFRQDIESGHFKGDLESLRGKNLACWCPLDQPCHADVLLGLANG